MSMNVETVPTSLGSKVLSPKSIEDFLLQNFDAIKRLISLAKEFKALKLWTHVRAE